MLRKVTTYIGSNLEHGICEKKVHRGSGYCCARPDDFGTAAAIAKTSTSFETVGTIRLEVEGLPFGVLGFRMFRVCGFWAGLPFRDVGIRVSGAPALTKSRPKTAQIQEEGTNTGHRVLAVASNSIEHWGNKTES